jgi:uncharacterized membrane protein YdjX (TVP38/TMEM64 family)
VARTIGPAILLAAAWLAQSDWLSLAALLEQRQLLVDAYAAHPARLAAGFIAVYVLTVSLFLPTAVLLAVAAGAIFGFTAGVGVIGIGAALGASLGFLLSRYLLAGILRRRWPAVFERIDAGVAAEGAFHLFALRVVPLVPFCVINLGMGLTHMPFGRYLGVSLLGTLPGILVFVNAGAQLGAVEDWAQPLTPALVTALCLLGLFPLVAAAACAGCDCAASKHARGLPVAAGAPSPGLAIHLVG